MPTCRIPPPKSLRSRRARRIASPMPARAEPIGAPSPLEKQIETVSKYCAHSRAGVPRGNDRVHQPGTVQVHGQVVLASPARDLPRCSRSGGPGRRRDCECSPDRPAGFGRNDRRRAAGSHRRRRRASKTAISLERSRRHAREPGDPARLPHVDVRRRRAQQLVARLRVDADADLVGHRSRRNEDRRLLAEQLGGPASSA